MGAVIPERTLPHRPFLSGWWFPQILVNKNDVKQQQSLGGQAAAGGPIGETAGPAVRASLGGHQGCVDLTLSLETIARAPPRGPVRSLGLGTGACPLTTELAVGGERSPFRG